MPSPNVSYRFVPKPSPLTTNSTKKRPSSVWRHWAEVSSLISNPRWSPTLHLLNDYINSFWCNYINPFYDVHCSLFLDHSYYRPASLLSLDTFLTIFFSFISSFSRLHAMMWSFTHKQRYRTYQGWCSYRNRIERQEIAIRRCLELCQECHWDGGGSWRRVVHVIDVLWYGLERSNLGGLLRGRGEYIACFGVVIFNRITLSFITCFGITIMGILTESR